MPPRRTGSATGPQTTASGKPASQGGSGNVQKTQQSSGDRDGHRDDSHKAQHHAEHTSRPNSAGQKGSANDSGRRSQATDGKSPPGKRHEGNARSGNTSPSAEGARHATHRSDSPVRENRDDSRAQQTTRRQNNGSGNGGGGGAGPSSNNSSRHQPVEKPQEKVDQTRDDDSKPQQKKHTARRGTRAGRLHRTRKPPEEAARQGRGGLSASRRRDSDADSDAGSEEAASESADSAYDAHHANETNSSWSEDRGEQNRQNRSQQQQQRSQGQSQSSSQTQTKQPWLNPSLDFFYKDNLIIINLRNEDEEILHPQENSKPAATAQPSSKSKRDRDQPTVESEWHAPAETKREADKGKPESVLQRSHAPKEEFKELHAGNDVETSIVDRLKHALADLSTTSPTVPPANATPPGLNLASHGTVAASASGPGGSGSTAQQGTSAAASKPAEVPPAAPPAPPSASFTVAGSSKEDEKPKLSAKAAPWKPTGQPVDLRMLATQLHVSPAGSAPATGTSVTPSRPAAPAATPANAVSSANRGFVPSTTAPPFLPQGFTFSGVTVATPIPSPAQIQPANEPAPPFSGPTPTAAPASASGTLGAVSRPITTLSPLPSLYTDEVWSVESAGWGDIQQILKPREGSIGISSGPANLTPATSVAPSPAAKPATPLAPPTVATPQTPPSPPQAPTPTKAAAKRAGGTLPSPQKPATGASTATPAATATAAPATYAYYPSAGLQWMAPGQPMYFMPNPAAATQQMIYAYAQQPATQYVPAYVFSGANPGASQITWGAYPSASAQ